jgi:hypothetical protein
MTKELKTGDRVAWDTPQGETHGRVVEKVTGEKRVGNEGQKGTRVKGSKDDPRYVVESDKTGKRAAHRADALRKR